jgi:nicotinamidase-related amidase
MLQADKTVLLVVDLQEKLLPVIRGGKRVVKNSVLLLRLARVLDIPIVVTTQYTRGLGPTVPDIANEAPGLQPLDKVSFGAFGDEGFRSRILDHATRDQILVCGIETHICVCQTVLAARERGYAVHVAADAVSSRSKENHRTGLARMQSAGAMISSTEMAVYELLGRSDTPAFKSLLPLLKG